MANDYQQTAAWLANHTVRWPDDDMDPTPSCRDEATVALRAVRAFEALASGRVVLWEPEGYRLEWFATRDDDAEQRRYYAFDPLDAITQALEVYDA